MLDYLFSTKESLSVMQHNAPFSVILSNSRIPASIQITMHSLFVPSAVSISEGSRKKNLLRGAAVFLGLLCLLLLTAAIALLVLCKKMFSVFICARLWLFLFSHMSDCCDYRDFG